MRTSHPTRPSRRAALALSVILSIGASGLGAASVTADDGAGGSAGSVPTATASAPSAASTAAATQVVTGTFADGGTWVIEVPKAWNGTMLLYSHGLVPPGEPNPASDAPDPLTHNYLVSHGFALAGSSFDSSGWAIESALTEQSALVDIFAQRFGKPKTTIAWGSSLGGLVSSMLVERRPNAFDGGLSVCGTLAGGDSIWNQYLDALFVFERLVAPDLDIPLVHIVDAPDAIAQLTERLITASTTPAGAARIALAATIAQIPGWAGAGSPRPAADDFGAQAAAQAQNMSTVILFGIALRAEMEQRIGGNPSFNLGIDYASMLQLSGHRAEVDGLYAAAGLDLDADLAALATAPRIDDDGPAADRMENTATFRGLLKDPLLALHTTGDPLAVVENVQSMQRTLKARGRAYLARSVYTERAGHCTFTPAETLAAVSTIVTKARTGQWPDTSAGAMNNRAKAFGPALNVHVEDDSTQPIPTKPAFRKFTPGTYLRYYNPVV